MRKSLGGDADQGAGVLTDVGEHKRFARASDRTVDTEGLMVALGQPERDRPTCGLAG